MTEKQEEQKARGFYLAGLGLFLMGVSAIIWSVSQAIYGGMNAKRMSNLASFGFPIADVQTPVQAATSNDVNDVAEFFKGATRVYDTDNAGTKSLQSQ